MSEEFSREQFYEQVMEIVRTRFPLVKLSRSDRSFALRMNGHVASLENLYRAACLKPDDLQRQVERWALELLRVAEGTPDRNADYAELQERVMPMLVRQPPGTEEPDPALISQPLVADLRVAYVIDSDRSMSYIPPGTLARWNVDLETLHQQAIANLVKRSEQLAAHAAADESGKVSLILFQTMDGYDAARLLLPTLHERLREHLGSPFLAGVPNRDILLCFRDDSETRDRLQSQISDDYHKMPNNITDKLVLVTADGLAAHSQAESDSEPDSP